MTGVRILATNGPAIGREFPDVGDALFVLADDYTGCYRYEVANEDGGRVYVCRGFEPLDALPSPVTGFRV